MSERPWFPSYDYITCDYNISKEGLIRQTTIVNTFAYRVDFYSDGVFKIYRSSIVKGSVHSQSNESVIPIGKYHNAGKSNKKHDSRGISP